MIVIYLEGPIAALAKIEDIHDSKSIVIAKGEHKEIKIDRLRNFTVGNTEVISHKYFPKKRTILIKGKKIGFTEIFAWTDSKKLTFKIFTVSKNHQLKLLHLVKTFKNLSLSATLAGTRVIVKGEINNISTYRLIKKILKDNKNYIHTDLVLENSFKLYLIGEIYNYLFNEYIDHVSCHSNNLKIFCTYKKSNPVDHNIKKYLKETYNVIFIPLLKKSLDENYLVKLKLLQIEKLDGTEINLGLNEISGSLNEIFVSGIQGLISSNKILLSENNIDVSTLAEPESLVLIGIPIKIEVGSEIPFAASNKHGNTTNWKFAGLKIKLTLEKHGNKYKVSYTTEFTGPTKQGHISGNKEKSAAILKLNSPITLFHIGMKTRGTKNSSIPFLGSIPILGNLFRSKSNQNNYKKITGVIMVVKNEP